MEPFILNGVQNNSIQLLCLAATCAACVGCGAYKAYDGPKRPPDQTATVRPMIDRKDCSYLDIRRIDTRRVYIKPEGPLYPHQMVIQPGEHLLVVTYWKGYVPRTANHYRLTQEIQLNITAKAHHNYELKYRILSEDSISVWAEDIETGDIVSDVVTAQVEERSPSPFQPVPIPMPITRR